MKAGCTGFPRLFTGFRFMSGMPEEAQDTNLPSKKHRKG